MCRLFQLTIRKMLEEAFYICDLRPENTYVKILLPATDTKQLNSSSPRPGVLATAIYSADEAFFGGHEWRLPGSYANRTCNYGDGITKFLILCRCLRPMV